VSVCTVPDSVRFFIFSKGDTDFVGGFVCWNDL
jgi:hypothetical protein